MFKFHLKNLFRKGDDKEEKENIIKQSNDKKWNTTKKAKISKQRKKNNYSKSYANEKIKSHLQKDAILGNISDSIFSLKNLSERTYNALFKNGIEKMSDFSKYPSDIRELQKLRGVGDNAIKELDNAFKNYTGYKNYSIEGCDFYKIKYVNNNNTEIGTKYLSSFFVLNGLKYHIDFPAFIIFTDKRLCNFLIKNKVTFRDILFKCDSYINMKGVGKTSLKELYNARIKILMFYGISSLDNVIFDDDKNIDLLSSIRCFYENLLPFEKELIISRLKWFKGGSDKVTLEEMRDFSSISRERVRQIQEILKNNYSAYISYISGILENSIIRDLGITRDLYSLNYSDIIYSSTLNNEFLQETFSYAFKNNYGFRGKNDFYFFFSLYNKNLDEIRLILDTLDIKYEQKRVKPLVFGINDISKKLKLGNQIEKYYDIIEFYLLNNYGVKSIDGKFLFPTNKRNYNTIVMDELKKLDKPIHFSELYEIIKNKYPEYKWREESVHSQLVGDKDALNVGKGLYIHVSKRPYLKGLSSCEDVVVKFLTEKDNHRATISEIKFFVGQYMEVDAASIESAVKLNKYGNFERINNMEVGLKGKWY